MNDYQLRAYSMTRGRAAVTASVSYDDKSGVYAEGLGIVSVGSGGRLDWTGAVGTLGYAHRIDGDLSLDMGILRAQFSPQSRLERAAGYTELYVGANGRWLSGHLSFSPDYFRPNVPTIYASVDAVARPGEKWRLLGHVGALNFIGNRPMMPANATQFDWRAAIARRLGIADLELGVSGGGPDEDYYEGEVHSKTAVTGIVRFSF